MTIPINTTRSGLARSLAASGLLSSAELDQVQGLARQEGKPLSTMLVDRQLLSSPELARFCEREYGQPLLDLDDFDLEQLPSLRAWPG
jgi:type IV pilus assembly protein PilB